MISASKNIKAIKNLNILNPFNALSRYWLDALPSDLIRGFEMTSNNFRTVLLPSNSNRLKYCQNQKEFQEKQLPDFVINFYKTLAVPRHVF